MEGIALGRLAPATIAAAMTALLIADVALVGAQVNPYRVQQRYNEARKGKSIEEWTKRLDEPDPAVRLEAVKSLGESGQPEATEYLIQAMGDPSEAVMIKAIDYLGKLRATDATQVLVQKLFMRQVTPAVKQRILVALGRMGDARAAQPISEFLVQGTDPETRSTAIFAIGEIGEPSALARLEEIQRDPADPNLARLAGEAIQKIKQRASPASIAVNVPALQEEEGPRARR